MKHHINHLEILGAFLAVKAFCREKRDLVVHLKLDSSTAIAYINHLGDEITLPMQPSFRAMDLVPARGRYFSWHHMFQG
jgi:hypothetical protein